MIVENGGVYHPYLDKKTLVYVMQLSPHVYFPGIITAIARILLLVPSPQQRSASSSI